MTRSHRTPSLATAGVVAISLALSSSPTRASLLGDEVAVETIAREFPDSISLDIVSVTGSVELGSCPDGSGFCGSPVTVPGDSLDLQGSSLVFGFGVDDPIPVPSIPEPFFGYRILGLEWSEDPSLVIREVSLATDDVAHLDPLDLSFDCHELRLDIAGGLAIGPGGGSATIDLVTGPRGSAFEGNSIELRAFYGEVSPSGLFVGPVASCGSPSNVEFPRIAGFTSCSNASPNCDPSLTSNVSIDLLADGIRFDFSEAGTVDYPAYDFNGWVFTGTREIAGVAIAADSIGLDPSRISIDRNEIAVHVGGLISEPTSSLELEVTFGGETPPGDGYVPAFSGNSRGLSADGFSESLTTNFAVLDRLASHSAPGDAFGTGLPDFDSRARPAAAFSTFDTSARYLYLYQDVLDGPGQEPAGSCPGLCIFPVPLPPGAQSVTSAAMWNAAFADDDGLTTQANPFGPDGAHHEPDGPANTGVAAPRIVVKSGLVEATDTLTLAGKRLTFDYVPDRPAGTTAPLFGFTSNVPPDRLLVFDPVTNPEEIVNNEIPIPGCVGDVNGDVGTGGPDFLILAAHFGEQVPAGTLGDLNGNGAVGASDFLILARDFGCGR